MEKIANVIVSRPHVKPSKPTHVPGVREGNQVGSYEKMAGHLEDGTSTAERSTGINPEAENPIHPESPNLSPA